MGFFYGMYYGINWTLIWYYEKYFGTMELPGDVPRFWGTIPPSLDQDGTTFEENKSADRDRDRRWRLGEPKMRYLSGNIQICKNMSTSNFDHQKICRQIILAYLVFERHENIFHFFFGILSNQFPIVWYFPWYFRYWLCPLCPIITLKMSNTSGNIETSERVKSWLIGR